MITPPHRAFTSAAQHKPKVIIMRINVRGGACVLDSMTLVEVCDLL